jgi:Fic family protein
MPITNRRIGQKITTTVLGEAVKAFVPSPLPPDPAINLSPFYGALDKANHALGRLDGLSTLLPNTNLFLYFYVRKEALLSSQIEGTQSSLTDLLLFENDQEPTTPIDDVEEVSNYVAAMNHGLERMKGGFPLSLRLIREIHGVLLRGGRGADKQAGEFRRSQNWIGGTRPGNAHFVPPLVTHLDECLSDFERFIHDQADQLPVLIKAALAHVQFETIHPFLDGNGRLGRLLITLILCMDGTITEPILYLSLYFKARRQDYYDLLNRVRTHGDWESWIAFFLDGVTEVASGATASAKRIIDVFAEDTTRIQEQGRRASTILRVHSYFQRQPYSGVAKAASTIGLSFPATSKAIDSLIAMGILQEVSGRARDRIFAYSRYLAVLSEGAAPL